jgi:DNA replication and repair protein RecF
MIVKNIELEGFRNYRSGSCLFDPYVNIITGFNAQGKTNLLEAVYYLAGARSFRTRSDRDIINLEGDYAYVRSMINTGGRDQFIDIYLSRRERKKIFVNGVKMKNAAGLAGRLCCVLFCPEDMEIVKGGSAERRRFMDLAICQLRPKYSEALSEFNRLYEHKTRILKDYKDKPEILDVLDDFSLNMAKQGAELIKYRADWCEKAREMAAQIHEDISGKREKLVIEYKTVSNIDKPLNYSSKELFERLLEHQEKHRTAEIESGQCLSGAHKDDINIEIDGVPASKYASQGQIRTAALSLKLAEREICFEDTQEYPVLLLDDVLSELDEKRQDYVLNCITGGQVFISCCAGNEIISKTGGKVIKIKEGSFQ